MQRRRIRQINPAASDSDRPMIEQRAREATAPPREQKVRWPFTVAAPPDDSGVPAKTDKLSAQDAE